MFGPTSRETEADRFYGMYESLTVKSQVNLSLWARNVAFDPDADLGTVSRCISEQNGWCFSGCSSSNSVGQTHPDMA